MLVVARALCVIETTIGGLAEIRAARHALLERAHPARESAGKDMVDTVVADAVRLIVWGRKWHELVELIGRFAGRPSANVASGRAVESFHAG